MTASSALIKGALVELEIESIASGGDAFSRIDGLAVFADRGLPGDRVRGTVSRKKKSFARVAVSEILAPSSDAVLPACEVSEICGGCRFWRAAYPDELRWKVEATRDAIERLARDVSWPAHQVIASVSDRGYRHRARFRMGPTGEVGFLRERSDEVVEGPGCPVLHPSLEGIRPTVRALFSGVAGLQSIFVEFDEVREGVAITAEFAERDLPHVLRTVRTRLERLKPLHDVTTVVVLAKRRPTAVVGDGSVWRRRCVGSERLIVKEPTAGFSQANARTNRLLVDEVASSIPESSTGSALELFGGAGNLTFPLVSRGYEVDSIDIADGGIHAAAAAWRGWDARPPRRIRFHTADLEGGLPPEVIPQAREVSVIVADPPRGGLSAALVEDLRLAVRARTFVYVSCDPPAMARDVSRLADQGWLPERVTFVDMFPKTPHMEAVVSLRRG